MFFCNNSFLNNFNNCCVSTCTPTACGPTVVITCDNCCTRVCSEVTFTITITNTATCTIDCAALHINLPRTFCLHPGSIQVDSTPQENATPECISLGTISPSQTKTVTYTVTVMECKRYNKTQALLTGVVCCCCENKKVKIPSNVNCLQVCCCCCGSNTAE